MAQSKVMISPSIPPAPMIQIQVGSHTVEHEGPLVHIIADGDVTFEQMGQLLPIYDDCLQKYGQVLILMNVTRMGNVGHKTRKRAADWSKPQAHTIYTAVYGASFAIRNVINLVHHAIRIIGKQESMLQFFETEDQGRVWLARARKQRVNKP